jgi:hypothetical protein
VPGVDDHADYFFAFVVPSVSVNADFPKYRAGVVPNTVRKAAIKALGVL